MGSEGAPRPSFLCEEDHCAYCNVCTVEPGHIVECTSLEEATYEGPDSDVGNMEAGWGWNMDVDDLLNIV